MSDRRQEMLAGARASFDATPRTPPSTLAGDVFRVPITSIDPDPNNARKAFDEEQLRALADDIKRHGQIQPAVAWHDAITGRYQLVAGERRWRACQLAGVSTLTVWVLPRDMTDDARREIAFAENVSRCDLKPTEVARHWQALMSRWGITGRELARRVGVAQSTVSKRLALLKLDAQTQEQIDAGKVAASRAVVQKPRPATRKPPRGTLQFNAGRVRLKRGCTLEQLHAELGARLAADRQADRQADAA